MNLLSAKQAAEFLELPLATTKKFLAEIPYIDFGVGRGRGKRWLLSDIESHLFKKRKTPEKKTVSSGPTLSAFSPSEFTALLNTPRQ